MDSALASAPVRASAADGASTSIVAVPTVRTVPASSWVSTAPLAATCRATGPIRSSVGARSPVATSPTARPANAPDSPPAWSASR